MLDFEIPADIDDLLAGGSEDNKYVVKRIYKLHDIPNRVDRELFRHFLVSKQF